MEQSTEINELAGALAKAQGKITGALKDSKNDFFKSSYADLAACWDACRAPLSESGLAVIQTTVEKDGVVYVVTTLAHSSGQWIRGWLPVKAKDNTPQSQGSGLTYSRRYALAGIVGLAQIDDDAEAAQGRGRIVATDTGQKLSPKQQKFVKEFTAKVHESMTADKHEDAIAAEIAALRDEMNEDKVVFSAVWENLDAPTRRAFKEFIAIHEKSEKAA